MRIFNLYGVSTAAHYICNRVSQKLRARIQCASGYQIIYSQLIRYTGYLKI